MRTEYLPTHSRLAGARWGLTPMRVARWSAGALLAASLAAAPTPVAAADANVPANVPTIAVTGSSLANVVVSPLTLIPAFDPTITDYVLRCQAGINTVHVSLVADGGTISAQGNHGATLDIRQDLIENQALVVVARAPHPFVKAQSDQAGVDLRSSAPDSRSVCTARARWLYSCFSSGGISPKVFPVPGTRKIGS